jgi:hypothetical protein
MAFDPDDLFERIVMRLVLLWGPFYAVFYIIRLLWKEVFSGKDEL